MEPNDEPTIISNTPDNEPADREKFEQARRTAFRKGGLIAGMALLGLFAADNLARLAVKKRKDKKRKEPKPLRKIGETIAKGFEWNKNAFAEAQDIFHDCHLAVFYECYTDTHGWVRYLRRPLTWRLAMQLALKNIPRVIKQRKQNKETQQSAQKGRFVGVFDAQTRQMLAYDLRTRQFASDDDDVLPTPPPRRRPLPLRQLVSDDDNVLPGDDSVL